MSAVLKPKLHTPQIITLDQLVPGQQDALDAFAGFMLDPAQQFFVVKGSAGTGKSTLVSHMLDNLDGLLRTQRIILDKQEIMDVYVTATTNKAVEALRGIVNREVQTIQSLIKMRVSYNPKTNKSSLVASPNFTPIENAVILIDEPSYISPEFLQDILERTNNCKLIFTGDPYQLIDPSSTGAVVFDQGWRTAELTQVVRQDPENPICRLIEMFRQSVITGKFDVFKPDGEFVKYVDQGLFDDMLIDTFQSPDWYDSDSKVCAWTNKRVQRFNKQLSQSLHGRMVLEVDDYAINNSYFAQGGYNIKTDATVRITSKEPIKAFGVPGNRFGINDSCYGFCPDDVNAKQQLIKELQAKKRYSDISDINADWIDLRNAYSCTVNKSQGSTYNRIFLDLDDIGKCHRDINTMSRLLYVGASRPRSEIILTGAF